MFTVKASYSLGQASKLGVHAHSTILLHSSIEFCCQKYADLQLGHQLTPLWVLNL